MTSDKNNNRQAATEDNRQAANQQIDDELILTNTVDDDNEHNEMTEDDHDEEKPVVEQSFRQALSEQIQEEDTAPHGQKLSVMKILGGEFFMAQILRRNLGVIIVIGVCIVFSISNRYSCEKSMLEIDKLKKELQDAKFKALSTSSRLTEQSRQSNVLEMLKNNKDSVLKIATQPPFIVNVPE